MKDIQSPKILPDDPDRFVRCQEALEKAFGEVASRAVAAGWKDDEVAGALVELADAHALTVLDKASVCLTLRMLPKKP